MQSLNNIVIGLKPMPKKDTLPSNYISYLVKVELQLIIKIFIKDANIMTYHKLPNPIAKKKSKANKPTRIQEQHILFIRFIQLCTNDPISKNIFKCFVCHVLLILDNLNNESSYRKWCGCPRHIVKVTILY